MKVQINDDVFYVGWKYDMVGKIPLTTCTIKNNDKEIVVEKEIKLYHRDKFDKDNARKFSLNKALKEVFAKQDRQVFWSAYLNR